MLSKVIIVKGNPRFIKGNPLAEKFYADIATYIREKGYEVALDAGEPYTSPPEDAVLWIGHSRGADRLRFAPERVRTLNLTPLEHTVAQEALKREQRRMKELGYNSLADVPYDVRLIPPPEHYVFTNEMKEAIDAKLRDFSIGSHRR